MGFSIFNLFKAGLLLTNSLLILNRRRFLSQYGLATAPAGQPQFDSMATTPEGLKLQASGLLSAVEYLKVPVIGLNFFVIVFEILLGGT